jgi:hypothetical protein
LGLVVLDDKIPALGGLRTVATAIALAGMLVLLGAVTLAWPNPAVLLAVCALDAVVLTYLAFRENMPLAHGAALPCLVLGYLTAFHLAAGNLALSGGDGVRLAAVLFSGASGAALAVLVVLLSGTAEVLTRRGLREHAVFQALGSAVVAGLSLWLVHADGLAQPGRVSLVCALYAVTALLTNVRWQRISLSYAGQGLFLAATLWALQAGWPGRPPLWGTVLALEALGLAALAAWHGHRGQIDGMGLSVPEPEPAPWHRILTAPCHDLACLAGFLALLLALSAPGFPDGAGHMLTAFALAAAVWLLVWVNGWSLGTWVGAGFLWAGLTHGLVWDVPAGVSARPWLEALLLEATLLLLARLVLTRFVPARTEAVPFAETVRRFDYRIEALFHGPLGQAGLLASLISIPILWAGSWNPPLALAGYATWLAVLWLAFACMASSPGWFTAFQAALSAATLLVAAAWVQTQPWSTVPADLGDLRTLQALGIGLGLLGLVWIGLRLALRGWEQADTLLEPPWPAWDRLVLAGMVLGQLALAVTGMWPGIVRELTPHGLPFLVDAGVVVSGPSGWLLLGVLAAVLVATLWDRVALAVLGLTSLALTVPVLAAAPWDGELATATALRWGLGLALLACSAQLWLREPIGRRAGQLGIETPAALPVSRWTRALVVGGTAAPILLLTFAVATLGFAGESPSGPTAGSFFGRLGWVASNVTPLVLLCLGLVGHALRERSPGYAFSGGLVAKVALVGGYALAVVTGGRRLDEVQSVRLLQLGTLAAGLWALAWLLASPWTSAWHETPTTKSARPLMLVQLGLALAGLALFLCLGLVSLVLLGPVVEPFTTETGSLLGWLALLAALTAPPLRLAQRGECLSWHQVGLGGAATVGLLACTAERLFPGWGYRVFLLGLAGQALLWSLGQFVEGRPVRLRVLAPHPAAETASAWVAGLGLSAVLLALKAAFVHGDWLWASGTVGLASAAGACMAFWLRRERWAFTAGLGVNLAASLAVCHLEGLANPGLWIALAQANVLASSAVALLWLLADRRFSVWESWHREKIPLLDVQCLAGLAGNVLLLVVPLTALAFTPGKPLAFPLPRLGEPAGWAACLLAAGAALWFAARRMPRLFVSIMGIGGLSVGVLAACVADRWTAAWLPYHVLAICWSVLGTATTILALLALREQARRATTDICLRPWSVPALRHWTEGLLLALVLLGLRAGWSDPLRPYTSAGPVGVAVLMAGGLALGLRQQRYVYLSGMSLTLAGVLVWVAWGPGTFDTLTLTVALSLALGALAWTLVDLLSERVLPWWVGEFSLSFQHVAGRLALWLAGAVVVSGVAATLVGASYRSGGALAWATLLLTVAALGAGLWEREARFAPAGLFAAGLLVAALFLQELLFGAASFARAAGLTLAGYLVLSTAITWAVPRLSDLLRTLPLPSPLYEEPPRRWFRHTVTALASVALAASLWTCLSFATASGRAAGPVAVALLLPACFFLADRAQGRWITGLRYAALAVGAIVCIEASWVPLDPGASGWLHHSAACLIVLTLLAVAYRDILGRWLPPASAWQGCVLRMSAILSTLAPLVLLVLLGQEFLLYDKVSKQTPLAALEVALVILAVVALIVLALRSALTHGRTLYVYGSELLLVLLFVHLKLNVPVLFGTWGARYWTLFVMALAYVGVGLGELFERRGLRVLAGPLQRTGLFLPLLPILVFWLTPVLAVTHAAESVAPGLAPLLDYLRKIPRHYDRHSLLWFLLSILYVLVALSRRSFRYALLAALAANFGLWALLLHFDVAFLLHPQMWLIPLALIVLVSEQLNRDRLSREQSLTLRYVALSLLYVSSTADLFIAGVGNSAVWPVVLAVLSVLGVLAGIQLRVRAFLFMGLTFLCLDVFAMIWHAAVDRTQTWVWYVSGIVLGGAILALFALFEKRRNDVLHLLEEIKRWH